MDEKITKEEAMESRFNQVFPLCIWMNRGRRSRQRVRALDAFELSHISPQRMPLLDSPRYPAGIEDPNAEKLALLLAIRRALRIAEQARVPALLLLDDTVALHQQFQEVFSRIEIPDNWNLFFLGRRHRRRPQRVGRGIVREFDGQDTHALGIHCALFREFRSRLKPRYACGKIVEFPDLEEVVREISARGDGYACFPNLIWRVPDEATLKQSKSDERREGGREEKEEGAPFPYSPTGSQLTDRSVVAGLGAEMVGGKHFDQSSIGAGHGSGHRPLRKIAFLFLTRDDVNHPDIWREYWESAKERVSIHVHAKHPQQVMEIPWVTQKFDDPLETAWGDVSLVRATLKLLKKALTEAENDYFVLVSESCVPVKPFCHLLRHLQNDPRGILGAHTFSDLEKHNQRVANRSNALPDIPRDDWRFQSQWFLLSKEMAEAAIETDHTEQFEATFAPDESYFSMVLAMRGFPEDGHWRKGDVTYTRWGGQDPGHPNTFDAITPEFATQLSLSPHFFARKFSKESNIREFQLHTANT